ncbi:arylamine N-acetyltransferase family protein [Hamadaea tsunoensis]|uniref:arylamine N-acetyltransferase family protein n=1 Tax=Hamadaea tsunoensis TaxID=53368 RepID=UPI00041FB885|nr:arylamine N-acetyltransferase [Hamadaea tsunoensis]
MRAYLARLGIDDPGAPSAAGLRALHRAQVERIPYEAIDIYLGDPPGIDPAESIARIGQGRGGYCYQLNGAFATLLTSLGYAVTWHIGGVHGDEQPVGATANHLALTVSGLPDEDSPDGTWFVDAGLGDALHDPLPLRTGVFRQGPFTFGLEPSTVVEGGWHFTHTADASFRGMDFGPVALGPEDFLAKHTELSTSPESGFVRTLSVQRRDEGGVDMVRGRHLIRFDADGKAKREIDSVDELVAILTGVFGLDLVGVDVDELWKRVLVDDQAYRERTAE